MMKKLYYGGDIISMDKPCQAVLTEDGVIIAAAKPGDFETVRVDEKCDLEGRTLMPAFIDSHGHFSQTAIGFLGLRLKGDESEAEIGEKISRYINGKNDGIVKITGLGTDIRPSRDKLKDWAKGRTLVLEYASGHSGFFSDEALKLLGEDSESDNFREENEYFRLAERVPLPDERSIKSAAEKARQLYLTHGICTAQEGLITKEMLSLCKIIYPLMGLDIAGYPLPECYELFASEFGTDNYRRGLRTAGMKVILDGSPQGRTAWMREPYESTEGFCSSGTMSDEALRAAVSAAGRRKASLLAHCNGDAAAAQFISCVADEVVVDPNYRYTRPVMIHAQLLGLDQLAEVKRLGILLSFFIGHVYYWGEEHLRNFGARAENISPAASALKFGIPFTLHQDSPVTDPNMFESIYSAADRRSKTGRVLGVDQRISVYEALRAVTLNAAYQYSEERSKGSISPGKRADFVVLDRNPLKTPGEKLREIQVLETIKDGVTVFKR